MSRESFEERLDALYEARAVGKAKIAQAERTIEAEEDALNGVHSELDILLSDLNLTADRYADAVLKGVQFLNENARGWTKKDKLSISDLNLSSGEECVLGQLAAKSALTSAGWQLLDEDDDQIPDGEGDYEAAINAFSKKFPGFSGAEYGFDWANSLHADSLSLRGASDASVIGYNLLNHMWTAAIERQRSKKKVEKKHLLKSVVI